MEHTFMAAIGEACFEELSRNGLSGREEHALMEQLLLDYLKPLTDRKVTVTTGLVDEGIIDSMGVMELLAFIESTWGVEFEVDDLSIANFATVYDIIQLIMSKRG